MFIKLCWNFLYLSSTLRCRSLSFTDWWKYMSCRLFRPTVTSFWGFINQHIQISITDHRHITRWPLRVLPGSLQDLDPDRLPHIVRPERGAPWWVVSSARSPPLHPQTVTAHLLAPNRSLDSWFAGRLTDERHFFLLWRSCLEGFRSLYWKRSWTPVTGGTVVWSASAVGSIWWGGPLHHRGSEKTGRRDFEQRQMFYIFPANPTCDLLSRAGTEARPPLLTGIEVGNERRRLKRD